MPLLIVVVTKAAPKPKVPSANSVQLAVNWPGMKGLLISTIFFDEQAGAHVAHTAELHRTCTGYAGVEEAHRSITSASRPSRARARASHPLSQDHTTTHVHTHTLRTHTNKGRIPHPPDQEFVASV